MIDFDTVKVAHEAFFDAFAGTVTELEVVAEEPRLVVVRIRNDEMARDVQLTPEEVRDALALRRTVRRELKTWRAALR